MSHDSEHPPVQRIVLPSGRSIDVVHFVDPETSADALHMCARCHSHLVQPLAWSGASGGRWQLTLECPNCGWAHSGVFDRRQVEELEEHLDEGLVKMLDDLRRLTQVNMSEELELFTAALRADLILPEDF